MCCCGERRTLRAGRLVARGGLVLLVAAIVVVALNQRPAVVGVAPVLGDLRADTGLCSAIAGLLTTLPVLCFGAFAPLAPRLARRIGLETAVAAVPGAARRGDRAAAAAPRWRCSTPAAWSPAPRSRWPTCCMPAYVKREFARPGAVMGAYSASLNIGAAAAAGADRADRPGAGRRLADGAGRPGWSSPSPRWRCGCRWPGSAAPAAGAGPERVPGRCCAGRSPGRSRPSSGCRACSSTRWRAWLPTLLADAGVPVGEGGLLLAVSNVVGAAGALLAPAAAGRMRTQRPLVVAVLLRLRRRARRAAAVAGLGHRWCGWPASGSRRAAGSRSALTLIVLRSATPLVAARLGGVAQCVGYLVAAGGPVVLGALHDAHRRLALAGGAAAGPAGADGLGRLGRGARRRPRPEAPWTGAQDAANGVADGAAR